MARQGRAEASASSTGEGENGSSIGQSETGDATADNGTSPSSEPAATSADHVQVLEMVCQDAAIGLHDGMTGVKQIRQMQQFVASGKKRAKSTKAVCQSSGKALQQLCDPSAGGEGELDQLAKRAAKLEAVFALIGKLEEFVGALETRADEYDQALRRHEDHSLADMSQAVKSWTMSFFGSNAQAKQEREESKQQKPSTTAVSIPQPLSYADFLQSFQK